MNIVPYYFVLKNKYTKLRRLEAILDQYKKNPDIKIEEIIYYFTEYNEVTHDMYQWPKSIYDRYNEEVETSWRHKVDND